MDYRGNFLKSFHPNCCRLPLLFYTEIFCTSFTMRFPLIFLPILFRLSVQTKEFNQGKIVKTSYSTELPPTEHQGTNSNPLKSLKKQPKKRSRAIGNSKDNNSTEPPNKVKLGGPLSSLSYSKDIPPEKVSGERSLPEKKTPKTKACLCIREKQNFSSQDSESVVTKEFEIIFKQDKNWKAKYEYNFLIPRDFDSGPRKKKNYARLLSNNFDFVLYFPFVVKVCSIFLTKDEEDKLEAHTAIETMLRHISLNTKSHYLLHFSFANENLKGINAMFNASFYCLICMLIEIFEDEGNERYSILEDFIQKLLKNSPFNEVFRLAILNMPEKMKEKFNLNLLDTNNSQIISIGLPVISLVYFERITQTNAILKDFVDIIWAEIIAKRDVMTEKNLSKFYQLEFLDEISRVTQEIKKTNPDGKIDPNEIFSGIKYLIEEFKFIGMKYPCRILRRENIELFEKFVNLFKRIDFLKISDENQKNNILGCICEFERFFHLQYLIFLKDVINEVGKLSVSSEKIEILESSLEVIGNFNIFLEVYLIKQNVREEEPNIETIGSFECWIFYFNNIKINSNYYLFYEKIHDFSNFLIENFPFESVSRYESVSQNESDYYPYYEFNMIQTLDIIDFFIKGEISEEDFEQKLTENEIEDLKIVLEIFNPFKNFTMEHRKLFLRRYIKYLQYCYS